jgi:hypothetical protein
MIRLSKVHLLHNCHVRHIKVQQTTSADGACWVGNKDHASMACSIILGSILISVRILKQSFTWIRLLYVEISTLRLTVQIGW